MTEQKFCKDCKFFSRVGMCEHDNFPKDIVYGFKRPQEARTTRLREEQCGLEAKWWEQKVVVVSEDVGENINIDTTPKPLPKKQWHFPFIWK